MSEVYDCTTPEGLAEGLEKAAVAVRSGEVVVLPTDTVYGVGADAFSPEAVASVLAAKGRGREMPPPVLVPSVRTIEGLATPGKVHPVQDAFDLCGALQCGFCQPGMMIIAAALLERNPKPPRDYRNMRCWRARSTRVRRSRARTLAPR